MVLIIPAPGLVGAAPLELALVRLPSAKIRNFDCGVELAGNISNPEV
jgi:hypothetical protein